MKNTLLEGDGEVRRTRVKRGNEEYKGEGRNHLGKRVEGQGEEADEHKGEGRKHRAEGKGEEG